jgi:hypothetical protein
VLLYCCIVLLLHCGVLYCIVINACLVCLCVKVCGKDADGGNAQSGCGKTYGWRSVPMLSIEDLSEPSAASDQLDVNSTELHFNVPILHRDHRKVALQCHSCKKDIYGARFECMTCEVVKGKPRSDSALCLSCVLQVITKHSASDELPFTHAGCAAVRDNSSGNYVCQACGGSYNMCRRTYGYRDVLQGWSRGETSNLHAQPESPNDEFCSQRCEDHGSSVGGIVGGKCRAHKNHVFDILPPPSTAAAASLLLMEVNSSSGEVSAYNLGDAIGNDITETACTAFSGAETSMARVKKEVRPAFATVCMFVCTIYDSYLNMCNTCLLLCIV